MIDWINNRITIRSIHKDIDDLTKLYNDLEDRPELLKMISEDNTKICGKDFSDDSIDPKPYSMSKRGWNVYHIEFIDEHTLILTLETILIPAIFVCIKLSKKYEHLEFILHYMNETDCLTSQEMSPSRIIILNGIADFSSEQHF